MDGTLTGAAGTVPTGAGRSEGTVSGATADCAAATVAWPPNAANRARLAIELFRKAFGRRAGEADVAGYAAPKGEVRTIVMFLSIIVAGAAVVLGRAADSFFRDRSDRRRGVSLAKDE